MKEQKHLFQGYARPNYTPVPDELFDEQLPDLSGAELKVLLYVMRRTFGFKRERDAISLSQMINGLRARDGRQLDRGVGLTKKTLLLAIKSLEEQNIILTERRRSVEKGDEPTSYRLNVIGSTSQENTTPPVGEKLLQGGGGEITPGPWGRNYPTQETERETERNTDFDHSNDRRSTRSKHDFVDNPPSHPITPDRTASSSKASVPRASYARPKTVPAGISVDAVAAPRVYGTESVGAVLRHGRGRPRREHDPDREPIRAFIEDFAREFNDQASLAASTTRAVNLYRDSGIALDAFLNRLYEARSIVKERSAAIRTQVDRGGWPAKNRMPYFFSVVADLLGLRDEPTAPLAH